MNASPRPLAAAAYLLACLVLGGASAAGLIANLFLQLAALVILLVLLFVERRRASVVRADRPAWLFAALFVLLVLLQLVPLPPTVWTALPGRELVEAGFGTIGAPLPWLPLSLAPDGTLRALVSLLPGLAILALVGPLSARSRRIFLPLVIGFGAAALLLGLTQLAGPPRSRLYFYAITNWGYPVGFFANRNHQATLLLMTLPFIAALATPFLEGGRIREGAAAKVIIIAVLFALVGGGLLVAGSRAGIALLPVVAGLCLLMVRKDLTGNVPRSWVAAGALLLVAGLAAVGASGVVTRDALSAGNVAASTRETIWSNSWDLAAGVQPAGSGLGSFVPLYRLSEDPLDRPLEFTNHVHNDWLEWLIETGVPGLLLLGAFLLWFALRVRRVWAADEAALGRAGSIALAAVMLHSLVDYPIRTAAIFALSALCLALMLPPREEKRA